MDDIGERYARGESPAESVPSSGEQASAFRHRQPWIKTLDQLRGALSACFRHKEGHPYIVQDIAKAAGLRPPTTRSRLGGSPTRWK